VTEQQNSVSKEERERVYAQRKRHVWLIVSLMTGSSCLITLLIFLVLWLVLK